MLVAGFVSLFFRAVLSGKLQEERGLNIDAQARNAVALIALPARRTVAPRYCNDGEKKDCPDCLALRGPCMHVVRFPWNWLGLEWNHRLCIVMNCGGFFAKRARNGNWDLAG